ncbi:hypothetical protein QP027_06530 [Corynebacterium breve]|uniref:Uncharacterized protein n=1 Tax=Corynebacterium breve TaxID=3049799 RepID=A0ABY8VBU5_9CORY|nr:hypothetical protein [Corynebacterium breve]WIM66792.1 hypothetical protein QP027_06530 [Corynebacterium breve]
MIDSFSPNLLVIPGSPALVRELSPGDVAGARLLSSARAIANAWDPTRAVEAVGSSDIRWRTALTGSFHAWGADVRVGHGHDLAELLARYVVGNVTSFRSTLLPLNPAALTVVVLDGPAGLTDRAPLALLDDAPSCHEELKAVLSGGAVELDEEELRHAGVIEPTLWLQLASLSPRQAKLVASDESLGVGRYVAAWEV